MTTTTSTPDSKVAESKRLLNQQAKANGKPDPKKSNKGSKDKPKQAKSKGSMFTRMEAVGVIMKKNPDATPEVIVNQADTLYIKETGHSSNKKETRTQYQKAVMFLKGYNSK